MAGVALFHFCWHSELALSFGRVISPEQAFSSGAEMRSHFCSCLRLCWIRARTFARLRDLHPLSDGSIVGESIGMSGALDLFFDLEPELSFTGSERLTFLCARKEK
jgi:hypothetical protein